MSTISPVSSKTSRPADPCEARSSQESSTSTDTPPELQRRLFEPHRLADRGGEADCTVLFDRAAALVAELDLPPTGMENADDPAYAARARQCAATCWPGTGSPA